MRTYALSCLFLLLMALGIFLYFRVDSNDPVPVDPLTETGREEQSSETDEPENGKPDATVPPPSIGATSETFPEDVFFRESLAPTASGEQSDSKVEFPRIIAKPGNAGSALIPLSKLDCENECEQFSKTHEREYCRHFCGISESQTFPDDCATLNGLKKDYCLKTRASDTENRSLCDEIADSNIRSACHNRIIENFMDKRTKLED